MATNKKAWINKFWYIHTVEECTTIKKEQTTDTYTNMDKHKKIFE